MDKEEELQELIKRLRSIAQPIGTMHSFWDDISDMECHLKGRPTLLLHTTEEWIQIAKELLKGR
jgi:hypothetical protein